MKKRPREPQDDPHTRENSSKRSKTSHPDRLSGFSDELILRVLSYLTVSQLTVCQRLSRKYEQLAGDNQLWKLHYYNRFVRPRASRIPGLKDTGSSKNGFHFTSRASAWLDEDHLIKRGAKTEWKRQYKLRHNWSKGSCAVNEIPVAEQAPVPPILVQMQDGVIYTVDPKDGLRAWSARGERRLIASVSLSTAGDDSSRVLSAPTSLAIDAQDTSGCSAVLIGFEDGSLRVYSLNRLNSRFRHRYTHPASSNGVLTGVAIVWPFVMTMTATQYLSLYQFPQELTPGEGELLRPPRLLHSLKSHTVWPPLSTSLRVSASSVLMSVAYALPTYLSGWTVGIQEVKVARSGELQSSRTASAIDQHYRPLAFSSQPIIHHLGLFAAGSQGASPSAELRHIHSKPTSLSYTHPYLLVSHPDNTLTLYLVTSSADTLSISPGSRLWGHTSSVSGAHVGGRGKAVSVSRRGDELRIWELEGGFVSSTARKRLASGDLSVQIKPECGGRLAANEQPQSGLDLVQSAGSPPADKTSTARKEDPDEVSELTLTRGWIGFDEENVVFLKEESQGKQALVVYDFT